MIRITKFDMRCVQSHTNANAILMRSNGNIDEAIQGADACRRDVLITVLQLVNNILKPYGLASSLLCNPKTLIDTLICPALLGDTGPNPGCPGLALVP